MTDRWSRVDILLATCNGERYLVEQLESLLAQTYTNTRILIRDDASKDQTPQIIRDYQKKYPGKILSFPGKERLGVRGNFSQLMEFSSSPYVMFSDQDDIWLPHKIEKTLFKLQSLEEVYGNHPYLVHSDLVVVDERLKVLDHSFWKYANLNPAHGCTLNRLLNQNVVTGCTMMVNRLMIELAKPIPPEAFMHDWWMALTAAAFGKIDFLVEPTIHYRQHQKNTLGAQKFGGLHSLSNSFKKLMSKDIRKFHQAHIFYHRYHDLLDHSHKNIMKAFLDLQRANWMMKRYAIYKHGFYKQGFLRKLADFVLG